MGCTVMICGTSCRKIMRSDHEEFRKGVGETKFRLETYLQDTDCEIARRANDAKPSSLDRVLTTALRVCNSNSLKSYAVKDYEKYFLHESVLRFVIGQMYTRTQSYQLPFDVWKAGLLFENSEAETSVSEYLSKSAEDERFVDYMFELYGRCYLKALAELEVCKVESSAMAFHHQSVAYDVMASLIEYNNSCAPFVTSEDILESDSPKL